MKRVLLLTVLLAGCRFRDDAKPSVFSLDGDVQDDGSSQPKEEGPSTPANASAISGGATPARQSGSSSSPGGAGGAAGGARPGSGNAAGTAAAGTPATAGLPGAGNPPVGAADGGSCSPRVSGCNPVTNEGCPDATQCVPDLVADPMAGYCAFTAPLDGGGLACFNSGVTESCPAKSTCFDNQCRTLCFCDDDCGTGRCCTEPLGSANFKLCTEC